jgi:hypothetical protein
VLSGSSEPDTMRRCADPGVPEFVAKPFALAALLAQFPYPVAAPVAARSTPPLNFTRLDLNRCPRDPPAPSPPS